MVKWPITRSWSVISDEGNRQLFATSGLARFRACCLLGSAGLGKTFELQELATAEGSGSNVRHHRLTTLALAADGLASRLATISADVSDDSVIYLDALDEVMVPIPTAGLAVATWIRDHLAKSKPKLRISCRSAIWPAEVLTAIMDVYGKDDTVAATLQALSKEDIETVASSSGINAPEYLSAVGKVRVFTLAQQPLTLQMLMRVFGSGGRLPKGRRELFHTGIALLLRERKERREAGTVIDVPLADLFSAAERLACYALFCGHEVIYLGDAQTHDAIDSIDLSLQKGAASIDEKTLRALASSALCDRAGPDRFQFSHRQLAEYLAGERVSQLPLHQARSLLASSMGWRIGVAGPLRETAAFAAMGNGAIASWVADYDAEIIGLSDVADDALRRRALLALLERARRHELTDTQFSSGNLELSGFQYPTAAADLSPVLRERGQDAEDVLECAIALIDSWNLQTMSNDLADLALDENAPMQPRKSAAYALLDFGTTDARLRLRPLLQQSDLDPEYELKGIALRCLWPLDLSVPELLEALTPRRRTNYYGAYDGFLSELERSGFSADGYLAEGLKWARQHLPADSDHNPIVRIAKRVAHRAVAFIPDAEVVGGLTELLLDCGRAHLDSPFDRIKDFGVAKEAEDAVPPLHGRTEARRVLVDALVERERDQHTLWWIAHHTPDLLSASDFPWLMQRSVDPSRPPQERKAFSDLSRTLAWYYDQASVESWLPVREVEPIASVYKIPLMIDLNSEAAAEERKQHLEMKRQNKRPRRRRLKPAPRERVQQALEFSENKDARFFLNLCAELTLEEFSSHYGFNRILTTAPGWASANDATRDRIIDAAKRALTAPTDEPEKARGALLSSILPGYMSAIFLTAELDIGWLTSQSSQWWARWAWYIVRELRPHMYGETDDLKTRVVSELNRHAPESLRTAAIDIAKMSDQESRPLLEATLQLLSGVPDSELDARLGKLIETGSISLDRLGAIAEFVLARDSALAMPLCLAKLEQGEVHSSEDTAVHLALALLSQRTAESWDVLIAFLQSRPDLAA